MLWLGGVMAGRKALIISVGSLILLILTHTRTALLAMVVGVIVGWPQSDQGQAAGPAVLRLGWRPGRDRAPHRIQRPGYVAGPR